MLTFMSLEWDSAPKRAAKLKALQDHYHTEPARAFNMLNAQELSTLNPKRGQKLIVNSHGNEKVFAGYDPKAFLGHLTSKGFERDAFSALHLMACKAGTQMQDNSVITNFARDLKWELNQQGISINLFAPRGLLSYTMHEETASGETYWVVDRMYIGTAERQYPLEEGMLLVQ